MFPRSTTVLLATLAAFTDAHGVILSAQGESGSPASVGFRVNPAIARNCTSINPCQQDATLIRDAEIAANIVNTCGRTELSGNIDVGEETENALAANQVTQVKPGTVITMTIHQVNADGAGPYVCDLDQTSNAGIFSHNLTVTDNVPGVNGLSQAKAQQFKIKVALPDDLNCIGGSTGNICTVRCRNNAQAGPFGGCIAVQQSGKEANVNSPDNIEVLKDLSTVLSQVAQNNKDFPVGVANNQEEGSAEAVKNAKAVADILQQTVVTSAFPVLTPAAALGGKANAVATSAATTTTAASSRNNRNSGNNSNNRNNNNNNNNNKRDLGSALRWAKRVIIEDSESQNA